MRIYLSLISRMDWTTIVGLLRAAMCPMARAGGIKRETVGSMLAATESGPFIPQRRIRLEKPEFQPSVFDVVATGFGYSRCPNVPLAPNVSEPAIG